MNNLRCACGVIDAHTHFVPSAFPAYLGTRVETRWPSMAPAQACHQHVMIEGKVYRTVSNQCWDPGVRLADMDASGVERHVVSPMPELLSYWLAPDDGAVLCRYLNESIAELVAGNPDRFTGLGAVPLQDVDTAIRELDHAIHQLGLAGVEIAGHINDVVIGDPSLRPFFEAAARWGAAVFVHPLRPAGMNRLVGPASLEQVLAFPGEIGLAAASMLTGGTLAALPGLRIAFSHGGGSLSALLPRLQHAWENFPALKAQMPQSPGDLVRRMFFDDLVYDADAIRNLIRLYGESQVMVGTDYPFVIMDRDPVARLESAVTGVADEADDPELARRRDLLRGLNARRWLGLQD